MTEIANDILPNSIKMKEDTCARHESGKIPILDCEMWVSEGLIRHTYYSKPMSSTEVILERSAISKGAKHDILTQEGSRRLRNCDVHMEWDQKVKYINKLMVAMNNGGHKQSFRETVAARIIGKYKANMDR